MKKVISDPGSKATTRATSSVLRGLFIQSLISLLTSGEGGTSGLAWHLATQLTHPLLERSFCSSFFPGHQVICKSLILFSFSLTTNILSKVNMINVARSFSILNSNAVRTSTRTFAAVATPQRKTGYPSKNVVFIDGVRTPFLQAWTDYSDLIPNDLQRHALL